MPVTHTSTLIPELTLIVCKMIIFEQRFKEMTFTSKEPKRKLSAEKSFAIYNSKFFLLRVFMFSTKNSTPSIRIIFLVRLKVILSR